MNPIRPSKELIKLYARQLRVPCFCDYENVIRQLSPEEGYDKFLCELMKQELLSRADAGQKRRIKAAKFPVTKTLDEFDYSRLEHVSQAYIQELASCDYIKKRQNIVMIGNPGAGKNPLIHWSGNEGVL